MSKVEALRQEIADANVFALLGATDTARLMIAQAVWARPFDPVSTTVWAKPDAINRWEAREVRQ